MDNIYLKHCAYTSLAMFCNAGGFIGLLKILGCYIAH